MKYQYGTILKFTPKALKKHPNHCELNDRMIVVGKDTCIWYKNEEMVNNYKNPPITIPANTIFMFDLYRAFDSFVEIASEEFPQLTFDQQHYSGGYMSKKLIDKYKNYFNIKMVTEMKEYLLA